MVDLPITKWIKKKIRRLIAIVEDTDVATHSIASGKYVVWKGDLCKSTAPIAVGGALSLSNLSPVSDGGLNELSGQIGAVNSKKITQTLLGSSATTANFNTSSINNYDLIVVALVDQIFTAIHGTSIISKSIYMGSSTDSAVGVSAYNNGRIYAYANYVNDTTSHAQVSAGYAVYLYGIRWN